MGKKVIAKATAWATASATVSVRVKGKLSQRHLAAAGYFASQCEAIEGEEAEMEWPQPRWSELQHCATASVILAAAALEASANELYLEAVDRSKSALEPLADEQMSLLAELWREVERKFGILEKYQVALTACGKPPMEIGAEPFQSASALIALRNALVHFKPEWDDDLDQHKKLENLLQGKFQPNALAEKASGEMLWFPNRCLGASCAHWACEATRKFSGGFCDRLEIKARL